MSMSTLIITLAGAMQFWSLDPGIREKRTNRYPTKSAVIGLVANALGRSYADSIGDLADLRFAVTIDQAGTMEVDFKTAGTVDYPALVGDKLFGGQVRLDARPTIAGAPQKNPDYTAIQPGTVGAPKTVKGDPKLIYEHYLADARFRVALAGDAALVESIHRSLSKPARPIYLGRRSYCPSAPLVGSDSIVDCDLDAAIADWKGDTYVECAPGTPGSELVCDQPVRFGVGAKRRWRAHLHRTSTDVDFFTI